MIIDSHSHWLPDEIISNAHFFHKGWGDIEAQVKAMQESGIDRAVLSYPTSDAHLKLGVEKTASIFNDNIAQILKRFPDKFIAAAILPAVDEKAMLAEAKRAVEQLGVSALSLASSYNGVYLDDKAFLPIYRYSIEKNLLIFVHSQIVNPIGFERVQDPLLTPVIEYIFDTTMCIGKLLMSGILAEFNQAKFVFAYFGGATPFIQHRFDATYQMLRGMNFVKDLKKNPTEYLKNIYVDTSGDKTESTLRSALEFFGPKHILWGSDWPAKKDISGSIEAINKLSISASDKQAILGGNLEKLLA
ncbi:MAG: amidohydrolase family protein [Candidatus Omnitrophica bacterium]|nr:amidohydrolase family protein [Candidatus Omnitrophota bacterium]